MMNKKKVNLKKINNSRSSLFKKDNNRLNYLFSHELFEENNNFILRLLKKSQVLPNKISLMKRPKNSLSENDKNDENDYKKDKVELAYELDDILYNNSKSFTKSKNKYYKIKNENDEFLEFYKFNKHHKSKSMKSKKKYDNLSKNNDKNEIEINEEDDDDLCYDAISYNDYLLIKEQDKIFFHFLNKSQNERKYYRFQGPYKYISKLKRYINTKSFDINDYDNNKVISENQNKKKFIKKKEKQKNKTLNIKDNSRNGKLSPIKNRKIKFDIIKGNNFKTIRINNKDKIKTNSYFSNIENHKTHDNLNINKLKFYKKIYGSNKNLVDIEEKEDINLSNNHLNQHHENNNNFVIFNNIKKEINNNKDNNTLNIFLNDNSNTIDNNINSDIKNKDKTKSNLKRGLFTNFSNEKINYKINKNHINNKISFRNKVLINNEKKYNRNNCFNKDLNSHAKSNFQIKALNNNNISTINTSRKKDNLKQKIKNNKLSGQRIIYNKNINANKSNLSYYYSNINIYKTINVSTNKTDNKIFNILKKINNSASIKNINNIYDNKNISQNILKNKKIKSKDNNFDNINDTSSINDFGTKTLNKEKKRSILGLYKGQKDKLTKRNERSIPNIRRRTYDKLIFYNKDLFSIKGRKNNGSFLTDPNNLNYSKILDKKNVINLNNLFHDIKSKNKDNKMYQFFRDQLYNNKILKKIEKANIYLRNLDKHFINKYTQFQILISNENDNL